MMLYLLIALCQIEKQTIKGIKAHNRDNTFNTIVIHLSTFVFLF